MAFNKLTDGQDERLSLLLEEMGEVIQCIGKIQRHGYDSYNPLVSGPNNREALERELGDVQAAMKLMFDAGDVDEDNGVAQYRESKLKRINRWMHHQPSPSKPGEPAPSKDTGK